eukprot:TRINITY_DN22200_c0_g1_i1.p1 TRINITY_DN22200_c0_g1~~TRINITY_DN22200_c0_g1_i1.p1  ORF type:complete len:127 (-),score=10.29 TRINITY_DN22200_c0_g1_i1:247-627(-)
MHRKYTQDLRLVLMKCSRESPHEELTRASTQKVREKVLARGTNACEIKDPKALPQRIKKWSNEHCAWVRTCRWKHSHAYTRDLRLALVRPLREHKFARAAHMNATDPRKQSLASDSSACTLSVPRH